MGTRHLYWILNCPSFAVCAKFGLILLGLRHTVKKVNDFPVPS